jgi:hypothetical protein
MMESLTPSPIETDRDVLIFEFEDGRVMVIGCDSAGGIGPKPLDKIRVDGYTLGKFTARVALMEVISTGAKPICLVDTLSVEPEPTGIEIIEGVKDEARRAGLDPTLALSGSSEKNIPVEQTGIGVTAIGMTRKKFLKIGLSKPNDAVVAIGVPCVGKEVVSGEEEGKIADTSDPLKLLNLNFVHEIIPVGSRGIMYEAKIIAKGSNLKFKYADQLKIDVEKSAGPATVILASLPDFKLTELNSIINKPINIVGHLLRK